MLHIWMIIHIIIFKVTFTAAPYGSELATKVLLIEGKKFYIDVKESRRGRFVKLSEVC